MIHLQRSKPQAFLAAAAALLLSAPSQAAGPVVLNEILANNESAVPVGIRHPDYIELLNASTAPVALGGATLTDGSAGTVPFRFPANTTLAPGARLIVWCDQIPELPPPQALFGISAAGEVILFHGPDGTLWDEVSLGLQATDLSVGRVPEGTGPWLLNRPTPAAANTAQILGTPTNLHVNEWMASPTSGDDWLELHNASALPVTLSGLVLTDQNAAPALNRPIPALSFLAPNGFVQFFASDLRRPDADHLDFRLGAGGDQIRLLDTDRTTVLDSVSFGTQQTDVSQGLAPDGGTVVQSFPAGQATPGERNIAELTRIVISEVLSHTDPPFEDAIELHNPGDTAVDISHWWISDDAGVPAKFRIPAGWTVPARGFLVIYEYQFSSGPMGFALNSYEGDEVWLSTGDATGRLTGERTTVRFGALPNGIPVGRTPVSTGSDFAPLTHPTFGVTFPNSVVQFRQGQGAANAAPTVSPIRLMEIYFAPPDDAVGGLAESFVELLNPGSQSVPLFDPAFPTNAWRLRGALRFDLPTGITLPPGGRLLVTRIDPDSEPARVAAFRSAHGIPASVPVLGPFSGNPAAASNGLELQYPDVPEGPTKPRPGFVPYVRAERVDYPLGAPWPVIDDGSGLALRRPSPDTFANDPASWSAAPPSPGLDQPDPVDADTDADGLPDVWETSQGLDPLNPQDASADPDGDGSTNLEEYLAGTHPRDAAEVLRIFAETGPGPHALALLFIARPGRGYHVESRPADTLNWTTLAQVPATTNPASTVRLDLAAPDATRFFRLRLIPPP